jgi:hypothetical protein
MKISISTTRVLACISFILGFVTDFMFLNYTNYLFIRRFLRIFEFFGSFEVVLFVCSIIAIFLGSIVLHKDSSIPTRFFAILGIITGMFFPITILFLNLGLIHMVW